jgi:hypothetical protein
MAIVYLARINPSDYEFVRGIINDDLPTPHEMWVNFQANGEVDLRRQGHTVSHIPIVLTNSPDTAGCTGAIAATTASWTSSKRNPRETVTDAHSSGVAVRSAAR